MFIFFHKDKDKNPFNVVNRLGMKMMIMTLIIIVAADVVTFSVTIILGMLGGGWSDTGMVIGSIAASIVLGALAAFIVDNTILKSLSELVKATKRVTSGDLDVHLEQGRFRKLTIKELRELVDDFNNMAEELRRNAMFSKDFISNFSHEFKTPLVSIRGFARQLYEGDLSPEQQREFSKIILDETEYLSVLSQNTLLMTSLENTDIVTDKTEFELSEQLRECMLRLEPQWSEKDIAIDMDLDEIMFYWNKTMLAHVWNNLFDNAVKFTDSGGEIKVTCKRKNGRTVVTVSDSGCGMPPEALPHIFEKFYQADPSHASKGNGLGLPLVKKVIELCGGSIDVESEVGKGTTFTVRL